MVGHPANDGPRHPVKGVLEVKTKGCGLPIRCVGSLYTMVGKFAPTRNANTELERGQEAAGLLSQSSENPFGHQLVADLTVSNGTELAMLISATWLLQKSQAAAAKECHHWCRKCGWVESQGGNERCQRLKSIITQNLEVLGNHATWSTPQ